MAEGYADIPAPRPDDIAGAVATLCPTDGCGFAILEENHRDAWGDDVQAAGGRDVEAGTARFTVERRVYARHEDDGPNLRRPFRHLVAGLMEPRTSGIAHIATNGFHVTVRANEVLSAQDVVAIMNAFLVGRDLPTAYLWRSNREEVEAIVRDTAARRLRH